MKKRFFLLRHWQEPAYLLALLILAVLFVFILKLSSYGEGDFFLFYQAGGLLLRGHNPYSLAAHVENVGFPYPPAALYPTLLFSLIPYGFAIPAWDLFCLFLMAGILYAWIVLIWRRQPSFPEFVALAAGAFIAPCLWAFFSHHLIVPVLALATAAVWSAHHKKWGAAGFWTGMMLIKPHLTSLLALLLLKESPRKGTFLAGAAAALFLSAAPFLVGYRPLADFRQAWSSLKFHSTRVYAQDDQDVVSNLYRLLAGRKALAQLESANSRHLAIFPVDKSQVLLLNELKEGACVLALAGWLFLLSSRHETPLVHGAALALALGVLTSRYSHVHDGTLLVPWVLAALWRLSGKANLIRIGSALLVLNFALALWLPFAGEFDHVHWMRLGTYSLIYFALGILAFPPIVPPLETS